MPCPICNTRKAKRFCPAKTASICSICCGTEREVSIDCPSDCSYLTASRRYDFERRRVERSALPFAETSVPSSLVTENQKLLLHLGYAICLFARDHSALTDSDVIESTKALAETHRTLESGLYYEQPPEGPLPREFYGHLAAALKKFQEERDSGRQGAAGTAQTRTGTIHKMLVFLAQLGTLRMNGRPKSRAFLDFLRSQFKNPELERPSSSIVLLD